MRAGDVRSVAAGHGEAAIATLYDIMSDAGQTATARLAAAKELLDRGHGKATAGGDAFVAPVEALSAPLSDADADRVAARIKQLDDEF
ncbi:hypothetical protein AEAC466_13405 [Asticcacaulis sp. AC466]|nr:hypothetical protein AEAC466_13405 [Asticcacaulis sp. AC466]